MENRSIYNEGRVVGLSAYEIYLKHFLSEVGVDSNGVPKVEPATEREWLSSTIGMGSSVLLKLRANDSDTVTYQLPENCDLKSGNTIIASFFKGTAEFQNDGIYAKSCKPDEATSWSEDQISQLKQYMKIVDGVVINNDSTSATVKFMIDGKITLGEEPLIILTGFTLNQALVGQTKTTLDDAENFDFLGPQVITQTNKIVFTIPSSSSKYITQGRYSRKIPTTSPVVEVKSTPIIDMATDPASGYSKYAESRIQYIVTKLDNLNAKGSVLTTYDRGSGNIPAGLYGTLVTDEGEHTTYLYPIDTHAPGNVKIFENVADAESYKRAVPYSNVMLKKDDGQIVTLIEDAYGNIIESPLVKISSSMIFNDGSSLSKVTIASGNVEATNILGGVPDPNTSPDPTSTISVDNLNWKDILKSLDKNQLIDILGDVLKHIKGKVEVKESGIYYPGKVHADKLKSTGDTEVGGSATIHGSTTVEESLSVKGDSAVSGDSKVEGKLTLGENYIQFSGHSDDDGLRLYVSKSKPERGMREGDIGIGW